MNLNYGWVFTLFCVSFFRLFYAILLNKKKLLLFHCLLEKYPQKNRSFAIVMDNILREDNCAVCFRIYFLKLTTVFGISLRTFWEKWKKKKQKKRNKFSSFLLWAWAMIEQIAHSIFDCLRIDVANSLGHNPPIWTNLSMGWFRSCMALSGYCNKITIINHE